MFEVSAWDSTRKEYRAKVEALLVQCWASYRVCYDVGDDYGMAYWQTKVDHLAETLDDLNEVENIGYLPTIEVWAGPC